MTANDFMSIAPMFASEDVSRPHMCRPFRHGNHLFATDGCILLVGDASGLDADNIQETPDGRQKSLGDQIIQKYVKQMESNVESFKYHVYGLCDIGKAVCAAFADTEPDMMCLRANDWDGDDPDSDGLPDSVRSVHKRWTCVIMPNPARAVIAGYYASLIAGLANFYGPVVAYADMNDPHAVLYFRGDNWHCALMPLWLNVRSFDYYNDLFARLSIADAATGKLVRRRRDSEPSIDELRRRFGK